jgi:hypothetical protein
VVDTIDVRDPISEASHGYTATDVVTGVAGGTACRQTRGWLRYALSSIDDTQGWERHALPSYPDQQRVAGSQGRYEALATPPHVAAALAAEPMR